MNKQQYLSLVASWKAFINEGRHKKYKVFYEYTDFNAPSIENGKKVSWTTHKDYGYKWQSDLTALHHLIYTLIRKRDVYTRFSEESIRNIIFQFDGYTRFKEEQYIASILEPFNGNITIDEVRDLISSFKKEKMR